MSLQYSAIQNEVLRPTGDERRQCSKAPEFRRLAGLLSEGSLGLATLHLRSVLLHYLSFRGRHTIHPSAAFLILSMPTSAKN